MEIVSFGLGFAAIAATRPSGKRVADRVVEFFDAGLRRPIRLAGIDRDAREHRGARELSYPVGARGAEDFVARARIGRDEVRHIFDHAENRFLQLMDEIRSFADDHRRERLRHRHENHAVNRERLQHRQGCIGGARRQVHEQEVEVAPEHLFVELADHAGDDRSAPDHRGVLVIREQVRADDFYRAARYRRMEERLRLPLRGRVNRVALDRERLAQTEKFWDGGPVMSASRMPTR